MRVVVNVEAMDFSKGETKDVIVDVQASEEGFDIGAMLLATAEFMQEWLKKQPHITDVRVT